MKIHEETLFLQNRRSLVSALIMSPLVLYSCLHEGNSRPPATGMADAGDFIVINGWVLLKQDLAE